MSRNRRSLVRRRKTHSKRRKSAGRSRLTLSPERLEERTLLAGDLLASGMSPWQNPYLATDVNYDLETTSLDALILIQSLSQAGSRSLGAAGTGQSGAVGDGEGEDDPSSPQFLDVNGDNHLSPLDVLGVINTINGAEGEGQTVTFVHGLTDLQGNPLQDRNEDGTPEMIAGDEGIYQLYVRDSRSPRYGVFSSYLNLPWDFGLATPAYQEVQQLAIDPTANGGSFTLAWGGSTSAEIDVGSDYQFFPGPIPGTGEWKPQAGLLSVSSSERGAIVQAAVETINGLDSSNVEVVQTGYLTYDITFTGNLANGNVAELVPQEVAGKELRSGMDVDGQGDDIPGSPPTAVVTVTERITADPDSDLSFISAANSAANLAIGAENRTYTFAFQGFQDKQGQTPGLKNIGATARLEQVGQTFEIGWADGWGPSSTHLFYAVRFTADNAGTLTLQIGEPAQGDNFTPDEVTVWPSPQAAQGSELNLFPDRMDEVEFPVALNVDIIELATAVDDNETVDEDSGVTNFNVLANDSVAEGTKQLGGIVTPPNNGQASVVGNQISYEPNLNYNNDGVLTDQIVYEMHNGQGNTDRATIFVTVDPVNDAPEFTPQSSSITIDEDDVAQTVNGWAAGIRPGPTTAIDEAGQVLAFTETLLNPGGDKLQASDFVTPPSVDEATGNLTFEVDSDVNGEAVVAITLGDDGGTANGGVNTSAAHTLTITVNPVNDTPVNEIDGDTDFTTHGQTVRTDQVPLVFSSTNNNELSVDDVDGNVSMQVTLSVNDGTLNVSPAQNVNIQDNGQATVIVSGLRDDVNAALGGNTVSYTPNPAFLGFDQLMVTTSDLGNTGMDPGLTGDGTFEQDEDTVQIEVVPPSRPYASTDHVAVDEDSGVSAPIEILTNDFDGLGNRPPTNVNFDIVEDTSPPANEGSVQLVGSGTTATYTYTTAQDFSGTTSFTYEITDPDGPEQQSIGTVTVTVNPVNDQPSFTASDPSPVNEDEGEQSLAGWASFDPGPQESGQGVKQYSVTNVSNPSLFSSGPTVATNGTLTYTPAPHANGSSTFDVTVQDDGGIDRGGIDTSVAQPFTITINAVNDPPTFTANQPPAVNEDVAAQSYQVATDFDPGPDDEENEPQSLVGYTVSNIVNGGLFSSGPSVDTNGTLTYTPAPDANGTATFQLTAQDDGGTDRGGDDTSMAHDITVTVNPVNDAPAFTANSPPDVDEDDGPQSFQLVTGFDPGPSNESSQQELGYNVSVTENPGLFSAPPEVATNGMLTYTTALHQVGQAKFTVSVQDDGGTDNGGEDTSPPQTFTLNVIGENDPPVNNLPGNQTTDEDTPFTFSDSNVVPNGITVEDPDAQSNQIQTTVSVDKGTLTPTGGAPTTSIVLTDTVGNINAALNGMTFTPPPGHNSNVDGLITLTITTDDQGHSEGPGNTLTGTPLSTTNSITIDVVDRNDAPLPQDDSVTMAEGGGSLIINDSVILANDSAGPNEDGKQTLTIIDFDTTTARGGTVARNGVSVTYTPPDTDFNTVDDPPVDTFTYTVEDDGTTEGNPDPKSATATVTVTVTEVNDDPIANDDLQLIPPNTAAGTDLTFSVSDYLVNDVPGPANEGGQALDIIAVSNSAKGVNVVLNGSEIIYTVPAGFDVDHMDTFTVTIEDNGTTDGSNDFKTDTSVVTVRDVVPSNVTGYVYDDLGGDGHMNGIDPGIGGVTVKLHGQSLVPNSAPVDLETKTDENGYYVFPGVLPNLDGYSYTVTQVQRNTSLNGSASVHSALNDVNDQQEASDEVLGTNKVTVALPLLGYDDGGNHNNNFAKMGLKPELASVDYRDLLNSERYVNLGLMWEVDENGNVLWWSGDWKGYAPGTDNPANGYWNGAVSVDNGRTGRITDTRTGDVHVVDFGYRVRWQKESPTSPYTIYRIYGGPDDFGLDVYSAANPGGEGEAIAEDQTVEMLAAAGDPAEYAAAVDAAFAAAEMSA